MMSLSLSFLNMLFISGSDILTCMLLLMWFSWEQTLKYSLGSFDSSTNIYPSSSWETFFTTPYTPLWLQGIILAIFRIFREGNASIGFGGDFARDLCSKAISWNQGSFKAELALKRWPLDLRSRVTRSLARGISIHRSGVNSYLICRMF